MKKILYIILSLFTASTVLANQPKDWQLGFQDPASDGMRDIVNFHNNLLLPIIIAISVFVLFLRFTLVFDLEHQEILTHLKQLTMLQLKFYGL